MPQDKALDTLIMQARKYRNLYEACQDEIETIGPGDWTPSMEFLWEDYKEAREEFLIALEVYEEAAGGTKRRRRTKA
jgi:hypothetical protein